MDLMNKIQTFPSLKAVANLRGLPHERNQRR